MTRLDAGHVTRLSGKRALVTGGSGGTLGTLEVGGTTDRAVWMPLREVLATESRSRIVDTAVTAFQRRA